MKKVFFCVPIIIIVVLAVTGGCFYFSLKKKSGRTVEINNQSFKIEISSTSGARARGLSGRESLCRDCGMLFEFPEAGNYSFWMKGMKFPLDIIWIRGNEVVDVDEKIPPDYPGILKPEIPIDSVLEINGGLSERYKIKKGSEVIIK